MVDTTYVPKIYKEPGGDTMVAADGGIVKVESGAAINVESGGLIQDDLLVKNIRVRATVAQVNAGLTLLAAVTGYSYRLVDCAMIAIGGAVSAVTTIDILGTQTTSKKLVAFGQVELTQSTVLKPGIAGATVLADGASFVACDAGTAISVLKTGTDAATATHVDIILSYVIEAE
jgi:hypothetical protein